MRRTVRWIPFLAAVAAVSACAVIQKRVLPTAHPEPLGRGNPVCTECHDPVADSLAYRDFDHGLRWAEDHRLPVRGNEAVCGMCHAQNFCNECHATRVELKPSVFRQAETYRALPHRGDYLSRHRIDARLDPTSCLRCHGNPKTAKSCARCHG